MTPKLRRSVSHRSNHFLSGRMHGKLGVALRGSQDMSLLLLENSLVTTQSVVARTQGVSESVWAGDRTLL